MIIECMAELKPLLQGLAGVEKVVAAGEPLPPFDLYAPMLSLPRIFGTTLESIPADVPYLRPAPALVETWRGKAAAGKAGLRVGLAWSANPKNVELRHRSMPLEALMPLSGTKGATFYSLQKGEAAKEALNPPPGMEVIDLTEAIRDFADTAALIANLDLVVSVDTAVAHLAGAMGKPVWTLVSFPPAWQWMLDREDSPWYPTMRLFRQRSRGDWGPVVERVAGELNRRVQGSGFRVQ